jgi:TonB family protein
MMKRFISVAAMLALCCAGQALGLCPQTNNQSGAQSEEKIYTRKEVDQPAKITYRPEVKITEEARRHRYDGAARVRVVLGAAGKVTQVEVLDDVRYGMAEACAAAARKIEFEPALKDGQAVSQSALIEYRWSFY